MSSVIIDDAMSLLLQQAKRLTELRDKHGNAPTGALPRRNLTTRELFAHLQSITDNQTVHAYLQQKIDALAERDRCAAP